MPVPNVHSHVLLAETIIHLLIRHFEEAFFTSLLNDRIRIHVVGVTTDPSRRHDENNKERNGGGGGAWSINSIDLTDMVVVTSLPSSTNKVKQFKPKLHI